MNNISNDQKERFNTFRVHETDGGNIINYRHLDSSYINNYLLSHGFKWLTSESDALGLRILFDLDESACITLRSFLQVTNIEFQPNWNPGSVASILLGRSTVEELFRYILVANNAVVVEAKVIGGLDFLTHYFIFQSWNDWNIIKLEKPEWFQFVSTDDYKMDMAKSGIFSNFRIHGRHPSDTQQVRGERNVHGFTGRA